VGKCGSEGEDEGALARRQDCSSSDRGQAPNFNWAAAIGYPRYPWIPQILELVCQFVHRPVCMPFHVSKFQRSSSNGSEMAAI
jgi:hypothetical protein